MEKEKLTMPITPPIKDYVENLYMEDVHSAALEGLDAIAEYLKSIKIKLSEEQEEEIYDALEIALEKLGNGNYRHDH